MATLELVAVRGRPLNNAGFLVPVFKTKKARYLQAGDEQGARFPSSVLEEWVKEESALLTEPLGVSGRAFTQKALKLFRDREVRYGFPAYVVFFEQDTISSLGDDLDLALFVHDHGGTFVSLREEYARKYKNYTFVLFSRDALLEDFLPRILERARERIDQVLKKRMRSRSLDSGHLVVTANDEMAMLARLMTNIAYDSHSIREAIRYQGLMLLRSPMAANFRNWVEVVVHQWNLSTDVTYWKNYALGIIEELESEWGVYRFEKVQEGLARLTSRQDMMNVKQEVYGITLHKHEEDIRDLMESKQLNERRLVEYLSAKESVGSVVQENAKRITISSPKEVRLWHPVS